MENKLKQTFFQYKGMASLKKIIVIERKVLFYFEQGYSVLKLVKGSSHRVFQKKKNCYLKEGLHRVVQCFLTTKVLRSILKLNRKHLISENCFFEK